jgi:hypothetical protein
MPGAFRPLRRRWTELGDAPLRLGLACLMLHEHFDESRVRVPARLPLADLEDELKVLEVAPDCGSGLGAREILEAVGPPHTVIPAPSGCWAAGRQG